MESNYHPIPRYPILPSTCEYDFLVMNLICYGKFECLTRTVSLMNGDRSKGKVRIIHINSLHTFSSQWIHQRLCGMDGCNNCVSGKVKCLINPDGYGKSGDITMTSHEPHAVPNHRSFNCLLNSPCGPTSKRHQSPHYWPFVRGMHRWPDNSPHKGPVMRKKLSFDDVIMSATKLCTFGTFSTFHERCLHYDPNSMRSWISLNPQGNGMIATELCIWFNSYAFVACASICCNLLTIFWFTEKHSRTWYMIGNIWWNRP